MGVLLEYAAVAAFMHHPQLEVGIETVAELRRRGYAHLICWALINYCLENGLEPVWSCRSKNRGSVFLAQSLLKNKQYIRRFWLYASITIGVWARLIKKVYGTDPLVCPRCESEMKIIVIIMEQEETARILEHLAKIGRPPPHYDPASLN